ncbi:MAG: TVP38/TMEM64 family protein [Clostridia bacterium]|nr:TVP38/TMEM64 family protein [Clostridia bacterium]
MALSLFTVAIVYYDELSNVDVKRLMSLTDSVPLMIVIVLAVYFVKALVFVVPASLVYVAVGAVLPPAIAVAVNLAGIFIEVSVTFLLGRFLGKEAVNKLLSRNAAGQKILRKNMQSKSSVLLSFRAIPAFPIDFISLFYGASGCGYVKYAALSVLGLSWRVILFTIIGDAVFEWIPMDKIILIVVCLIPLGVVWYLLKKFVIEPKKRIKENSAPSEGSCGSAECGETE